MEYEVEMKIINFPISQLIEFPLKNINVYIFKNIQPNNFQWYYHESIIAVVCAL